MYPPSPTLTFTMKTGQGIFGLDEYVPHINFGVQDKLAIIEEVGKTLLENQQQTNERLDSLEAYTFEALADTDAQIEELQSAQKTTQSHQLDLQLDVILLEEDNKKLKQEVDSLKQQQTELNDLVNCKFAELLKLISNIEKRNIPTPPPIPKTIIPTPQKLTLDAAKLKITSGVKLASPSERKSFNDIIDTIRKGVSLRRTHMNPDELPKQPFEPSLAQKMLSEAIQRNLVTVQNTFPPDTQNPIDPDWL